MISLSKVSEFKVDCERLRHLMRVFETQTTNNFFSSFKSSTALRCCSLVTLCNGPIVSLGHGLINRLPMLNHQHPQLFDCRIQLVPTLFLQYLAEQTSK